MIPRHAHKRSLSSEHRALSPDKTVTRAKSTTDLTQVVSKTSHNSHHPNFDESNFSTLRDPRLAVSSDISPSTSSTHHPDLSNEVAALSVKLIQAINNQTTLDDDLVATRQELEVAQGRIQALEFRNDKYRRDLDEKVYIKKSDADREILQLKTALAEERVQRAAVEKGKKEIEQELEALTADLFEEANKVSLSAAFRQKLGLTLSQMVAAAKIDREVVEKKNEQLRSQIKDTELLLASHQDQLAELKSVMQGMNISKDDLDARANAPTAPPSPAAPLPTTGSNRLEPEADHVATTVCDPEDLEPGPSCNFPDMIRMVCRTDLQAYEDFRELLVLSRSSKPPSRAGSGSYAGLNVMSLAGFGSGVSTSNNSSPTKGITHSPNGSLSSQTGSHIPLKETRFYKRVLMEDIEPTLRLDLAPGISWLTRRTVLSSICEGNLVVEPMPLTTRKYEFPCSVCGERRPGAHNERTHRFRTSDSENAQRYSLCIQCLERVRSCCEFTGYLRLILDGHLKAGDVDEEKDVWEETVRLRERMFWSRIAGGIVPLVGRPARFGMEPNEMTPTDTSAENEILRLHQSSDTDTQHAVDDTSAGPETLQHAVKTATVDSSVPDVEVARIATPEPQTPDKSIADDPSSAIPPRRSSVDSDPSVYQEASGSVAAEPAEPVVDRLPLADGKEDTGKVADVIAEIVDPATQQPSSLDSKDAIQDAHVIAKTETPP
ncbi:uncharacterized protein N7459_000684 [Penicillium hispanicum]|uniref:uncharacterized protein n=1 Tax=Penicillium hispanicum TaxID=1080232 RepID=UPI002541FFFE|nr:uncharacterized protein N7459_000684 [Penicillium hispanicum]KAJ5594476.1 hypothetical protein N7459_000684 [Penicillium hispanicum]